MKEAICEAYVYMKG